MRSQRLTISTCGTSILTNGLGQEDNAFLRSNANKQEGEYGREDKAKLLNLVEEKRNRLLNASNEAAPRRLSAELNGLMGIYDREGGLAAAARDTHFLICTDTFQGRLSAHVLEEWGRTLGIGLNVNPVKDLNTSSMSSFRLGINNLVEWCNAVLPGYRGSHRILFNLVGGFKSLQGYMQTLGMFYADETFYIFESGGELLSIPRLPVDFTESAKRVVLENLAVVRRLQWRSLPVKDCAGLPETMLDIVEGECSLSVWGKLIFDHASAEIYGKELLPPLSDRIYFSNRMESEAAKLDPDKRILLNRAIDNLSRYLDTEGRINLSSFNFRALEGDPKPPSTHEFNLWSTQNAWRGFCHYENGKGSLVVDAIDKGIGH